ncbi:hypothetical protein AABB24_030800 [Solanum stoloniferum]|uniref:Uncharacterized protein n=1 Tax=Solanum stoloniferum TaxID=62892 RepID=A0ABD2RTP2_9SOLN
MGPFVSSFGNNYILVDVDYVSKWVTAVALPNNEGKSVVQFLKHSIFARFGTPRMIISDGVCRCFCKWAGSLGKTKQGVGVVNFLLGLIFFVVIIWVKSISLILSNCLLSLNLSNMTLTGTIPRDLGNLTFLISLDLGSNNFHGNLPQEIAHLHRLKFLDLSFNNLRGEIPSWFGFSHQLEVLNLGNNFFTGSIPPSLSNASRLETLVISANLLEGNIPEEIGNLHNLKYLSIEANQLTGIEVVAFTNNSLSGNLPNGLCNHLPILKELHLSINKLHGHIVKLFTTSNIVFINK